MSPDPTAAATRSMIYVGMGVHKESITIAVLPDEAKTPTRLDRLANDLPKLKRWLDRSRVTARSTSVTKRAAPDMCCIAQYRSEICLRRYRAVAHSEAARSAVQA